MRRKQTVNMVLNDVPQDCDFKIGFETIATLCEAENAQSVLAISGTQTSVLIQEIVEWRRLSSERLVIQ